MLKKLITPIVLGAIAISIAPAQAASVQTSTYHQFTIPSPNPNPNPFTPDGISDPTLIVPGSTATLTRDGNNLSFSANASGLAEGAYTFWWGAFNKPEECLIPYHCTFAELHGTAGDPTIFRISSGVVGADGLASFTFNTTASGTPGTYQFPFTNPGSIGFAGNGLYNANAQIQSVLRYHGPVLPGQAGIDQLTMVDGGCGPNTCVDAQEAVFTAVPESSSLLGLLGLGALGMGTMVKRKVKFNRN